MNIEPMQEKLAEYQRYAEQHCFAETWLRMTIERTFYAVVDAMDATKAESAEEVYKAAWVAVWESLSAGWSDETITSIASAIERENKETA